MLFRSNEATRVLLTKNADHWLKQWIQSESIKEKTKFLSKPISSSVSFGDNTEGQSTSMDFKVDAGRGLASLEIKNSIKTKIEYQAFNSSMHFNLEKSLSPSMQVVYSHQTKGSENSDLLNLQYSW